MAYKIDGKPTCRAHPHSVAEVVCKTHRKFLCTQCLIDRESCGNECDLVQLRNIKSKQELIAVDLIVLEQFSNMKLQAREDVENFVEEQKKNVEESIDAAYDKLVEKLEEMKEDCKQQMHQSFDQKIERTSKEKANLERAIHSLQEAIGELINEDDAFKKRNYLYYDNKKKQAQKVLINLSDGDNHGYGRFVLASHLQDIVSDRKRMFGKSTLMMRFTPKN